jgi:carbonic anhydrase/acetyltransferase-like protein (isoleucine patch superfamily)
MPIRSFEGTEPELHPDAYVDETAVVIGDVTVEADASVWPNVVLRGDHGGIRLHEGANVQDGSVCHEGAEIGPYATVGHNAIVHGASVGDRALVGMGAIVLDDCVVGERAMVGANSLVTEGTEVPPSTLVTGTPATVRKEVEDSPWARAGEVYVDLAARHGGDSETLYERWPPEDGG